MRIRLNDGWEFALDRPEGFAPVTLPHDWLIGDPARWYASGVGYYRRTLDGGILDGGRRALLRFDGVYMDSALSVNGRPAGEWKYGFTAFTHDVTEYLRPGQNEVLLRVDAKFPSSRWYSGAGVTRPAWLVLKNQYHIREDGVYVTTSYKDGKWSWEATCEAETGGRPYEARHTVLEDGEFRPWSP
ncbi:MAG TPA: glycoside hydrolase family 2, partial [Candidatus Limnocylindria bacterium]|nr:glycoside hydrolase family 2 [Candidatus Limnocylindria bacterium]